MNNRIHVRQRACELLRVRIVELPDFQTPARRNGLCGSSGTHGSNDLDSFWQCRDQSLTEMSIRASNQNARHERLHEVEVRLQHEYTQSSLMQISVRTVIFSCIAILAACGPMGPVPGGAIEGNSISAPESWASSDAVEVITLETNPEKPYSVNIWAVGINPFLYIGASDPDSTWAQNIRQDDRVRVRFGDAIHDLKAVQVDDPATQEVVRKAFIRKYEMDPEEAAFEEAALFRLEGR